MIIIFYIDDIVIISMWVTVIFIQYDQHELLEFRSNYLIFNAICQKISSHWIKITVFFADNIFHTNNNILLERYLLMIVIIINKTTVKYFLFYLVSWKYFISSVNKKEKNYGTISNNCNDYH